MEGRLGTSDKGLTPEQWLALTGKDGRVVSSKDLPGTVEFWWMVKDDDLYRRHFRLPIWSPYGNTLNSFGAIFYMMDNERVVLLDNRD